MRRAINKFGAPYLAIAPVLALIGIFIYLPVVLNAGYSLHAWNSLSPTWQYVGFHNFQSLLRDPLFWQSLRGNLLYAIVSLLFQVILALVLAAILESGVAGRRWSAFFRIAYFIPAIMPVTVIGLLWQIMYQPDVGLVDQALKLVGLGALAHAWLGEEATALPAIVAVSQWQWVGYITVLFVVAIRAIPRELYEAAEIDGARAWRKFWHVTVPGASETTVLMALVTVFGSVKVFDIVWVMTGGGPNNASDVLGTYMYRSAFREDRLGYAAAIAVIMFAICAIIGGAQLAWSRRRSS